MAFLTDLLNPSFFIILGIVALLIALLVLYFENKMRDQNHKIASMLSLVSTLAEDMNGVKMGFNHLAVAAVNGGNNHTPFTNNLGNRVSEENNLHLIEVSDDESEEETDRESDEEHEDDENDQDNNDDSELEEMNHESESESESDDDDSSQNVKVIKLNISENNEDNNVNSIEDAESLAFEINDDLEDTDDIPEISQEYTEELLSLKYDDLKDESHLEEETAPISSISELKTISINLGEESKAEHIDYKKLQLPKLRSIVVEKGLINSSDAQKLKKPELLKLLGVE